MSGEEKSKGGEKGITEQKGEREMRKEGRKGRKSGGT